MEKEDLDFLKEMLKSMDKKDERRHNEVIKLTNQTNEHLGMTRKFMENDLKATKNIEREMKTTRIMIHTKYHLFGAMMSVLISMMSSLLTNSMIEPWKLSPEIQTSASVLIMLITLFISFAVWWKWGKEIFFEESHQKRKVSKKSS